MGLLLNELERPLPLVGRLLWDSLDVGEPRRIIRALCLYHAHVDAPFSRLAKQPTQGAIENAEALCHQQDDVRSRAWVALARGTSLVYTGEVEQSFAQLETAEELFRDQCTGATAEMRMCRQIMAPLMAATVLRITEGCCGRGCILGT